MEIKPEWDGTSSNSDAGHNSGQYGIRHIGNVVNHNWSLYACKMTVYLFIQHNEKREMEYNYVLNETK
jgi:hypothetical protein